jgi:hypothetical protein
MKGERWCGDTYVCTVVKKMHKLHSLLDICTISIYRYTATQKIQKLVWITSGEEKNNKLVTTLFPPSQEVESTVLRVSFPLTKEEWISGLLSPKVQESELKRFLWFPFQGSGTEFALSLSSNFRDSLNLIGSNLMRCEQAEHFFWVSLESDLGLRLGLSLSSSPPSLSDGMQSPQFYTEEEIRMEA